MNVKITALDKPDLVWTVKKLRSRLLELFQEQTVDQLMEKLGQDGVLVIDLTTTRTTFTLVP